MTLMVYVLVVLATVCQSNAVFVNDWDQSFKHQCPSGTSLSSIYSEHDNKKEDRRWSLACARTGASESCAWTHVVLTECTYTGWQNDYDRTMDFKVPAGKVLRGAFSLHDNKKEDRRWVFTVCSTVRIRQS